MNPSLLFPSLLTEPRITSAFSAWDKAPSVWALWSWQVPVRHLFCGAQGGRPV